jgi:hypothetical protein
VILSKIGGVRIVRLLPLGVPPLCDEPLPIKPIESNEYGVNDAFVERYFGEKCLGDLAEPNFGLILRRAFSGLHIPAIARF